MGTINTYDAFRINAETIKEYVDEKDEAVVSEAITKSSEMVNESLNDISETILIVTEIPIDKNTGTILDAFIVDGSNTILASSTTAKTLVIPCDPSTTYVINKLSDARFRVGYGKYNTINSAVEYGIASETADKIVIETSATARYLHIYYYTIACSHSASELYNSLSILKRGYSDTLSAIDKIARYKIDILESLVTEIVDNYI